MAILETIQQPDPNRPKIIQSTSGRVITEPSKERVRVYALDGSFRDVWPVDAREMVATHPNQFSLTPFEVGDEQQPEQLGIAGGEVAGTATAEAGTDSGKDSNRANRRKSRGR